MDYQKHYNLLISTRLKLQEERNINKKLKGFDKSTYISYHNHHIIPKCLAGTNDKSNLILLTPREHLICHIFLAKLYPKSNLVYAVWRMTHDKSGNKLNGIMYEWLCNTYSLIHSKNLKNKKRKPFSAEHCRNLSISQKNKKLTNQHKLNISKGSKGIKKPFTEEHKRNISKNHGLKNIMPWKTSMVINNNLEYNWTQLDIIYNIWIKNSKPGYGILSRLSIDNDSKLLKSSSFNRMIKWFKENGNPRSHRKWLEFKNSYTF